MELIVIEVKDRIDVRVDGKMQTIIMTFGLLNRLSAVVDGLQDLSDLGFGPENRIRVMTECFRLKGKNGFLEIEPDAFIDLDEHDIEMDDVEALLDWATSHLTNFFIKRLKAAEKGMVHLTEAVAQTNAGVSELSQPGLQDSTSLTPSAGPSS